MPPNLSFQHVISADWLKTALLLTSSLLKFSAINTQADTLVKILDFIMKSKSY